VWERPPQGALALDSILICTASWGYSDRGQRMGCCTAWLANLLDNTEMHIQQTVHGNMHHLKEMEARLKNSVFI